MKKIHDYYLQMLFKNICSDCRNPKDEVKNFCKHCGHIFGFYKPRDKRKNDLFCYFHPVKQSTVYCNLCDRFFCEECIATEKGGASILGGFPWKMCKECDEEINQTKNFKDFICPNHPLNEIKKAEVPCSICQTKICLDCAKEYSIKGQYYCPIHWRDKMPWYKRILM